MRQLDFVVGALKDLKGVGTVFPCSPASARKMTKPIDFKTAQTIVELGSGTGAITEEILRNMRPGAKLIGFELNPVYVEHLRAIKDERMTIIQDSAEHLERYLKPYGIDQVDAVISTLPFVLIDEKVRNAIMDAVMRALKPGGHFVQIQYSLITKKEMEERFHDLKIDFTPFNIPPAFFYIVTKPADSRLDKVPAAVQV